MESVLPSGTTKRRIELRLRRPLVTWFARPTVVIDGVGQPAQWGTGTWAVPDDGGTELGVYLYNRAWRFGTASIRIGVAGSRPEIIEYRAGLLPIGPGRMTGQSD